MTGPSHAGAKTASEQWAALESGACSYIEVELPPAIAFDEAKARRYYGGSDFTETTSKGQKKLDKAVTHWTGVSDDDLAGLSHLDKIKCIVEARRAQHEAPIDQICKDAALLYDTLVTCRTPAAEFHDVQNCVASIAHGSSITTTDHGGFLDAKLVDQSIDEFEAARADDLVGDLSDFWSASSIGHGPRSSMGMQLTESLNREDSPLRKVGSAGRISIISKEDLLATDLSTTKLVPCFVVCGGVRDVDDVESPVNGRLVVVLQRRGELYHFLISRGQFLLVNQFTPACAVRILQIAVQLLYLTYRQDTDSVPPLKKEERSGGGLVVGKAANGKMIADFKNVVPKMVARGVSIKTSKCLIKFE